MNKVSLAANQKSSIITDLGGSYLNLVIPDEDGVFGNTQLEETTKNMRAYG